MLNIAIIGYGQMGKMIEQLAPVNNCRVVAKIDPELGNEITVENLKEADVCIEFTHPKAAPRNIKKMISLKKNVVSGTTGWFDEIDEISELIASSQTGLVYGSNFSIGMNLFYEIVRKAASLLNIEEYDPFGLELHHNKKKDSPSGTAKVITDIVLAQIDRKEKAVFEKLERKIEDNEFHFSSVRAGNIPGEHVIGFDSEADTIVLKHVARSRKGLALGALKAARWLAGKKGIYDFSDIVEQITG